MAKSRAMTGFNGEGAFNNLTPESVLEDLQGANEGVNVENPRPTGEGRVRGQLFDVILNFSSSCMRRMSITREGTRRVVQDLVFQ